MNDKGKADFCVNLYSKIQRTIALVWQGFPFMMIFLQVLTSDSVPQYLTLTLIHFGKQLKINYKFVGWLSEGPGELD